jgi:hypothetical protein
LARIDPELLCPVKHRSAQAQAELMNFKKRKNTIKRRSLRKLTKAIRDLQNRKVCA